MSTYTCPHCGERGLSTQKRHWCPKAPKISEVLRLGPPRSRDPIANEYIDRLSRELEEAQERERGYREALCRALDRGFPGDTHEGDCAVTRGMQCDCWIGQARALASTPPDTEDDDV